MLNYIKKKQQQNLYVIIDKLACFKYNSNNPRQFIFYAIYLLSGNTLYIYTSNDIFYTFEIVALELPVYGF